jgi:hypothetical protein
MSDLNALPQDVLDNLMPFREKPPIEAVYFLLRGERLVYIGETCNLARRIEAHRKDKMFDEVRYLEASSLDLRRRIAEGVFIRLLRPPLNVVAEHHREKNRRGDEIMLRRLVNSLKLEAA